MTCMVQMFVQFVALWRYTRVMIYVIAVDALRTTMWRMFSNVRMATAWMMTTFVTMTRMVQMFVQFVAPWRYTRVMFYVIAVAVLRTTVWRRFSKVRMATAWMMTTFVTMSTGSSRVKSAISLPSMMTEEMLCLSTEMFLSFEVRRATTLLRSRLRFVLGVVVSLR